MGAAVLADPAQLLGQALVDVGRDGPRQVGEDNGPDDEPLRLLGECFVGLARELGLLVRGNAVKVWRGHAKEAGWVRNVFCQGGFALEDGFAAVAVVVGFVVTREVLFDVADAGEGFACAAAVEGGVRFPEGAGEESLLGGVGGGNMLGAFWRWGTGRGVIVVGFVAGSLAPVASVRLSRSP